MNENTNMPDAETMTEFDIFEWLMTYEDGRLSEKDTITLFQMMVNNGMAWTLQGSIGRVAQVLIDNGFITLGEERRHDAYGTPIPSKYDIVPGSIGSQEFVNARTAEREAQK